MPCTALLLKKDDITHKVKFMSQQQPTYLELLIYYCDDEFIPIGNPEHNASDILEEDYHKNLRKAAAEHNHFVPEQSTNPEWNPGYIKPIEDATI